MDAKTRDLLERAVPFLRDAGGLYEDDGGNEPLELSRRIEDALEAEAALAAMGGQGEAAELLRGMGLDPERFRTEGGRLNPAKVRAAIRHPESYAGLYLPREHDFGHSAKFGGEICSLCGAAKGTTRAGQPCAALPAPQQPEARAVARLVIVDRGGGFKAIRTWDDIGDLPPGEHFLFSATHPTTPAVGVEDWKARALAAEADIERMTDAFNRENGPTFMGEPAISREAFKVRIGDYLSEDDLEALGISADWHLYLSPSEPPSAAQCNQQMNAYDLSACPCCGGRATIIGTLKTCEWSAICTMCGLETAHMMQPKDAAFAWNRRHAPDEEGKDFEELSDAAKDRLGVPFPAPPAQQPEAQAECTNRGRCDCIGECKHGRGGSGANGVPEGMALAYGYLWHAGNPSEVRGDNLVLPPEIAAAKARLELRGLLTTDQRCRAIDKVRAMLAAAQKPEKE